MLFDTLITNASTIISSFSLFLDYSTFFLKDSKENIDLLDFVNWVNRRFYIHHCTVGENEFLL